MISNVMLRFTQAKPTSETLYLSDGVRRIDMVLAYEDEEDSSKKKKKRETFEKNLREQGLTLETELKTVSLLLILPMTLGTYNRSDKYPIDFLEEGLLVFLVLIVLCKGSTIFISKLRRFLFPNLSIQLF